MSSPGVVFVDYDETADQYRKLRLPKNWTIQYGTEWGSLQASMQWCFRNYPAATQYGWLADDTYPRTEGWDRLLEHEASDWCVSYARDLWLSEQDSSLSSLEFGDDLSSGLCWGGELVRTVGWWALPGVVQGGIDTAWCAIIGALGLGRYRHDIIVEHKNYRTGKRERDSIDDWHRDGTDYIRNDILIRNEWAGSTGYRDILARVAEHAKVELSPVQLRKLRQIVRDSHANERWKPTQSAARLINVLERIDLDLDQLVADVLDPNANPG